MAMPPERSRPLHNFTLPRLRWGNQKFLRCMKVNNENNADGGATSSSATNRRSDDGGINLRPRPRKEVIKKSSPLNPNHPIGDDNDDDGIEAVREKLMLDLRVAADRMKVSILGEKEKQLLSEDDNSSRPCNLRTRRAACKDPGGDSGDGGGVGANGYSARRPESLPAAAATAKSSRLRGLAAAAAVAKQSLENGEKSERPKFSLQLTREEIESDFIAMTGKKPPRRPKKRPRAVQRQMDSLFPGTWLTEVTPETYKVPDIAESGKNV